MTKPTIKKLPGSRVELAFVITPAEAQPYLDQAAQDLQTSRPIQGFRAGKAPYDIVKREFGEMRIWETALERIVRAQYVHAVLEEKIDTVGSPGISVEQLVPGQDLKFTVTASVMPQVTRLMTYDEPLVTKKVRTVKADEVDKAIEDLRKMRRQEVIVNREATKDDMLVIDLEIKRDGVVIEGGTTKGYHIYMAEAQYIPGFADQLVGLKKDDVKNFTLPFPTEHYQKHLAGKDAEFSVTVTDVYELKLPELNDEFAQSLGVDGMDKLKEMLRENLQREAEQKADEAAEVELIEKLIKGSSFTEVPELLINEEVRRMYAELEHAAEEQGMKMADYLSQLKKTMDEIKLDLVPRAIERVQAAVLMKEIAQKEGVTVTEEELDLEIDRILSGVKDKDTRDRVTSPDFRDYLTAQMRNRKTVEALKQKSIKEEQAKDAKK